MGKGKMSDLDVRVMVRELQKLLGTRLANLYHLSSRCFVLKLASSERKARLLIESGVRLHTSSYEREHDVHPNGFALKLRKHLRTLRLEAVRQVGNDRIVSLQFGSGDRAHFLVLEVFAQGNIVLLNHEARVLIALRSQHHQHDEAATSLSAPRREVEGLSLNSDGLEEKEMERRREGDEEIDWDNPADVERRALEEEARNRTECANRCTNTSANCNVRENAEEEKRLRDPKQPKEQHLVVRVHEIYPLWRESRAADVITREMIQAAISREEKRQRDELAKVNGLEHATEFSAQMNVKAAQVEEEKALTISQVKTRAKQKLQANSSSQGKKKPKVKSSPLKAVFAATLQVGPELTSHCLTLAGFDPNAAFNSMSFDATVIDKLVQSFAQAPLLLKQLSTQSTKGYIVIREENATQPSLETKKVKKKNKWAESTNSNNANEQKGQVQHASHALDPEAARIQPSALMLKTPVDENALTENLDECDVITQAHDASTATTDAQATPFTHSPSKSVKTVKVYSEFLCTLLAQHNFGEYADSECTKMEFDSLDSAMDEYYSKLEEQREEIRLMKEKAAALHKIERFKVSHEMQLQALNKQLLENDNKAQLIECNTQVVDAAIASVNAELSRGTDWPEIARIIKNEKACGNPIAVMISALKFDTNQITLILSDRMLHLRPGFVLTEANRPLKVDVDLSQTAFVNAQRYYQARKKQAHKADKTIDASAKAMKAAEKKTEQALNAVDVRARIQKQRRIFWFEKFHWFITSENYLVIGGKDAQQNELVVKRHLARHDAYVHADVQGASSIVVKNPSNMPLPPYSLAQAGLMCVSRSAAWKSKTPTDSYWVYPHQVSKTAPTGMFLQTGSFMIRGKKNYLPRMPMVMGLALLFKLDDNCLHKHADERIVKSSEAEEHPQYAAKEAEVKGFVSSRNKNESEKLDDQKNVDDDFDVTSQLLISSISASAAVDSISDADTASEDEIHEIKPVDNGEHSLPVDLYGPAPELQDKKKETTKKRMSAAEKRKRTKQLQSNSLAPRNEDDEDEDKPAPYKAQQRKKDASMVSNSAGIPLPRGKRGKYKKVVKRYKNQDEEDLDAAASLLGLQNVAKKKKELAEREALDHKPTADRADATIIKQASESDEDGKSKRRGDLDFTADTFLNENSIFDVPIGNNASSTAAVVEKFDSSKVCFRCKERGHVFKHCPQHLVDSHVSLSAARRALKDEDEKELQRLKEEEDIHNEKDQHDLSSLSLINTLTGRPLDDDLIEFCVPVCAPYITLQEYKYRVKLTNGTQKKGKLSSTAITLFCKQSGASQREIECMHSIKDEEMTGVLLSNIKLSAPGLDSGSKRRKGVVKD